jgi:hypothetical protein
MQMAGIGIGFFLPHLLTVAFSSTLFFLLSFLEQDFLTLRGCRQTLGFVFCGFGYSPSQG